MAKKKKNQETNAVAESQPAPTAATPEEAAPAVKKSAAKKSAKKVASSKSAGKKTAETSPAKKAATKTASPAKAIIHPSDEQISIRAYFIAERRAKMSLHGDPNNDWIQAREELIAELNESGANGNGSH